MVLNCHFDWLQEQAVHENGNSVCEQSHNRNVHKWNEIEFFFKKKDKIYYTTICTMVFYEIFAMMNSRTVVKLMKYFSTEN